jgi:ribosome-binding protein aMBF1 (putative translation factor)
MHNRVVRPSERGCLAAAIAIARPSCLLCDRPIQDAQRRTVSHEGSDFAVCALCAVLRELQQATAQADLTADEEAAATRSLGELLVFLQRSDPVVKGTRVTLTGSLLRVECPGA